VFSKSALAIPLTTKGAQEVTAAFENKILIVRRCRMLQTKKGSELTNYTFQNMMKKQGIHCYTSDNDEIKAAVVDALKECIYPFIVTLLTRTRTVT
jgi:histone H3/H4